MKRSKLLITAIFFALSFLAITPAHAATTQTTQSNSLLSGLSDWLNGLFGGSGSGSGGTSGGSTGGSGGGTSLPINNNIWLLVVAGAVVGCKVIVKNTNTVQTQKI
jgi:hypothetical protein